MKRFKAFTAYNQILTSMFEFNIKKSLSFYKNFFLIFVKVMFNQSEWDVKFLYLTNWILKDLILLLCCWRIILGYPTKGQRTHANGKKVLKNKILFDYRLNQFYQLFGKRKRNIYPTLIVAEYNNRLWYHNWNYEWLESMSFALRLINQKKKYIPFDPVRLAKNHVNGFTRTGKAAKMGKAKKITQSATLGVPVFFSRILYSDKLLNFFPYRLWISDSDRKKMGKKRKKNKK